MKHEARYLKSLKLNLNLLYIFLGERRGSEEEKNQLREIIKEIGDEIYTETISLLTHTLPRTHAEAKKIIVDIISLILKKEPYYNLKLYSLPNDDTRNYSFFTLNKIFQVTVGQITHI